MPYGARLLARCSPSIMKRLSQSVMRSYHFRIPKYDLPLRLRPWFLVFTCLVMVLLAFLGFINFFRSFPLNDKLLHFLCFGLATGIFYFIIDVEEEARRIWFWRHSGLIFTTIICFFCGGILSEVVQSLLPSKEFQSGNVAANLLGASVGLFTAYHLEKIYRHRREIARLYQPLDADAYSDSNDEEDLGVQLLPTHAHRNTDIAKGKKGQSRRLADIWDTGEEIFEIGDDDEDLETPRSMTFTPAPKASSSA